MSDIDSIPPTIPRPLAEAFLDSILGPMLVQSFLTGAYVVLFIQTIVPLIRDRKRMFSGGVLMLLFAVVLINMGATWQMLQDIMITHSNSWNTMILEFTEGPVQTQLVTDATWLIVVLIADALLLWRCYIMWRCNKIILCFSTALLLGEVSLVLITMLPTPAQTAPTICLFVFLSIGITTLATGLIIYRIADVSNRIPRVGSRYQFVIEVLVESGVMYSINFFILGVLLAVRRNEPDTNYPMLQASSYWAAILTPVAGIAPTLITMRVVSGAAREETTCTQPISGIFLNTTPHSQTE